MFWLKMENYIELHVFTQGCVFICDSRDSSASYFLYLPSPVYDVYGITWYGAPCLEKHGWRRTIRRRQIHGTTSAHLSTSQHCLTDSDRFCGVPRLAAEQLSSVNSPMARELQPPSIQPISKVAVLRIGRTLGNLVFVTNFKNPPRIHKNPQGSTGIHRTLDSELDLLTSKSHVVGQASAGA